MNKTPLEDAVDSANHGVLSVLVSVRILMNRARTTFAIATDLNLGIQVY